MHKSPSADSQRVFAPGIFKDQVAIVTGGGSGIGLTTALELARLGARVAVRARTADKLERAAAELTAASSPDRVLAATCDIREPTQVADFVKDVISEWGRLDILVNNAGGQFPSPAQHISPN